MKNGFGVILLLCLWSHVDAQFTSVTNVQNRYIQHKVHSDMDNIDRSVQYYDYESEEVHMGHGETMIFNSVFTFNKLKLGIDYLFTESPRTEDYKHIYQLTADVITHHQSRMLSSDYDVSSVPDDILNWPAKGNPYFTIQDNRSVLIDRDLAPFFDNDNDGIYDPMQGDVPCVVIGDNKIIPHSFTYNTFVFHNYESIFDSGTGDLLVEEVTYMTDSKDEVLDKVVFHQKSIRNLGDDDIANFIIAIQDNHSTECIYNDHRGIDTLLNVTYVYDGKEPDGATDFQSCETFYTDLDGVSKHGIASLVSLNQKIDSYCYGSSILSDDVAHAYSNSSIVGINSRMHKVWTNGDRYTIGGSGYNPSSKAYTDYVFTGDIRDTSQWLFRDANLSFNALNGYSTYDYEVLSKNQKITLDYAAYYQVDSLLTRLEFYDKWESDIRYIKSIRKTTSQQAFSIFIKKVLPSPPKNDGILSKPKTLICSIRRVGSGPDIRHIDVSKFEFCLYEKPSPESSL